MTRKKIVTALAGIGVWIAGSLLAALLIQYNAVLGIGMAVASGVGLGVHLFAGTDR